MKNTTYSCDICKEEKEIDDIMSYRLVPIKKYPAGSEVKNRIELSDVKEDTETSKKHICDTCVDIIYRFISGTTGKTKD